MLFILSHLRPGGLFENPPGLGREEVPFIVGATGNWLSIFFRQKFISIPELKGICLGMNYSREKIKKAAAHNSDLVEGG